MIVVVCNPDEAPESREVPNTLQALQALVGGYIQCVPLRGTVLDGLDVYVNEDGLALAFPFNREIGGHHIVGPIVISKADDEGDQISLSPEDVGRALSALARER